MAKDLKPLSNEVDLPLRDGLEISCLRSHSVNKEEKKEPKNRLITSQLAVMEFSVHSTLRIVPSLPPHGAVSLYNINDFILRSEFLSFKPNVNGNLWGYAEEIGGSNSY